MKIKNIFWLIILFFAIAITATTATFVLYKINSPIETKELQMYLNVGEKPGVNIDTDALYFGSVPPSGSSARQFEISNNKNYSIKVALLPKGELSSWTKVSENNILLKPYATKLVNITVFVPSDAKLGNYSGILVIEMRRG